MKNTIARTPSGRPIFPLPQLNPLTAKPYEATPELWPRCPRCNQSATGRYAGAYACTRDGWNSAAPLGTDRRHA